MRAPITPSNRTGRRTPRRSIRCGAAVRQGQMSTRAAVRVRGIPARARPARPGRCHSALRRDLAQAAARERLGTRRSARPHPGPSVLRAPREPPLPGHQLAAPAGGGRVRRSNHTCSTRLLPPLPACLFDPVYADYMAAYEAGGLKAAQLDSLSTTSPGCTGTRSSSASCARAKACARFRCRAPLLLGRDPLRRGEHQEAAREVRC